MKNMKDIASPDPRESPSPTGFLERIAIGAAYSAILGFFIPSGGCTCRWCCCF
ncbi:MAG: hypothetical protein ACRYHA_00540 [Janthinobacterium lividum]